MTAIFDVNQIKSALKEIDVVKTIEEGFIAYSRGNVVSPPSKELVFQNPPGEIYIKYGNIIDDEHCVIKVWSGFSENINRNLPTCHGLMLVLSQKTGEVVSILLDDGYLTNVRTGAAGAVVANYLAPHNVQRIGMFGAGAQARLQLEYLGKVVQCRDVIVWGINHEELVRYKNDMEPFGFTIETTLEVGDIPASCNLIITATPATSPLLLVEQIKNGTHITAIGAGTPEKIELDSRILQEADIVVADSISHSRSRGEIYHAVKAGLVKDEDIVELGKVIVNKELQRTSDDQITVADLTGIAAQDIQIAVAVYEALKS